MMSWNNFNFNFPSSEIMMNVFFLHDFLLIVVFCIMVLVLVNIYFSYDIKNFNMGFLENHYMEFIWTVVPFLILSFIIFSSINNLYFSDSCFFCGVNLILMGHQWYWSYFLKDFDSQYYDSYMINNFLRVLDVDNRLVLPYNIPIRILATSSDVIHSWTIPSMGLKMDCVPGRLNQMCVSVMRPGIFFGQCSEICGINHSFMPIVMESVSLFDFFKISLLNILI